MAAELRLTQHLTGGGIDRRQRATPESDEESPAGGIVANVVGILSEPD